MSKLVNIRDIPVGQGNPLVLIAGPCVLESEAIALETAQAVKAICERVGFPYVFKSSYDKANRSSIHSFRGPGLAEGAKLLARVRETCDVPVLVDVHGIDEVEAAAEVADVLQIPAFLCRQTDFVLAVARTGKPVNVKKGQFLSPWEIAHVVEKIESTDNRSILLTERGTSFGYNNLVVDFRAFPIMAATGYPVIFDVTHSCQLPGERQNGTGGQREFIPTLARAAVAAKVSGLFMEVHPDPEKGLCDTETMFPVGELEGLLRELRAIERVLNPADTRTRL